MAAILRALIWLHRYLGIAVGLVMLLWCLSGFVMLYRGYPHLDETHRTRALEPLHFNRCCAAAAIGDDAKIRAFQIEMMASRPVMRVSPAGGSPLLLDLASGSALPEANVTDAAAGAILFGKANMIAGSPHLLGLIAYDQWTLEDAGRRGPVYRFEFRDPQGTELYVAQQTGRVVQVTTRAGRLFAWLGAIPHWLYPTVLRQNVGLWSQVVIWIAVAGTFLSVMGLYIGIARLRRWPSGRWTPYRGWHVWHHYAGLAAGVVTLTWVGSGLLTMNPWGWLETPVQSVEAQRISGLLTGRDVKAFLDSLPKARLDAKSIASAPLGGRLFAVAAETGGGNRRLDIQGARADLTEAELRSGVQPFRSVERQTAADNYFYTNADRTAAFPVFRVEQSRSGAATLYIEPVGGQVVEAIDDTARLNRWVRFGLHDWDFGIIRARPLWDVIVLTLLASVLLVTSTGVWLGYRRLRILLSRRGAP